MHIPGRLFWFFAWIMSATLIACSGGAISSGPSAIAQPTPTQSLSSPPRTANVSMTIVIPKRATAANMRRPAYISPSTMVVVITLTSATAGLPAQTIFTFDVPSDASCVPVSGATQCTLSAPFPVGSDNFTVATYDSTSTFDDTTLLSSATSAIDVTMDVANRVLVTLDAQVGPNACPSPSIVVTAPGVTDVPGQPVNGTCTGFTAAGQGSIDFYVTPNDAGGNAIPPGQPWSPILSATFSATGPNGPGGISVYQNPYHVIYEPAAPPTTGPGNTAATGTVNFTFSSPYANDGTVSRSITVPFNIFGFPFR